MNELFKWHKKTFEVQIKKQVMHNEVIKSKYEHTKKRRIFLEQFKQEKCGQR